MHAIRNAIDHGIEPPEERQLAGKSPIGQLALRAKETASHPLIEQHGIPAPTA